MHLGLIVVDTCCITVVLDDIDNQTRHCVQGMEGIGLISSIDGLGVAANAAFGANTKEERGYVLGLQNPLLCQRIDEGNEGFFR